MASTSAAPTASSSAAAAPLASAPANPPIAIEPDLTAEDYGPSADSAYDSEVASYTTSLASNVTDYKFEHGRRYHAYKEGAYIYPNDEKENDRLDIAYKMIEVALGGKLHKAPVVKPSRVLDIGTGTGIWAMEMGDVHPNSDILGNDLSPIQPRWVPPNVHFEVDDVEADWTYSQKFDFIHCRCMGAAIRNWNRLIQQIFEFTKPGGYAELIDFDLDWTSPDGSLKADTAIKKANNKFMKITRENGIEPCIGPLFEQMAKDVGFVDVVHERIPLPVGTWPADKHLKEIGAWNFLQVNEGLEGFFFAIFTRVLGYSKEEVEVMCANFRKDMKDPRNHSMFWLHVVYGRKPEEGEKAKGGVE